MYGTHHQPIATQPPIYHKYIDPGLHKRGP